jgi:hypothetical protein
MNARRAEGGFSLVEVVVSVALALVVAGAAFTLIAPEPGVGRTMPEVADAQERARIGQDLIARDLYAAGAGVGLGPATGPLGRRFAPILPRRMGRRGADTYATVRPDAITILYVPRGFAQTTLRDPLLAGGDLRVDQRPNCADALCGLAAGSSVLVFDEDGHFDGFTVTGIVADSARVRPWQAGHAPYSYVPGAVVTAIEWHTYYLDSDTHQVRHFDGDAADIPVVDDAVGLSLEYFGDPGPIDGLGQLPAQGGSLAALPLSLFGDGPWRGDGENRFDADLLRIRTVRVTLRVQVGNDMMRGRSPEFAVAGRSLSAARSLPDYALRFDVAPRNMGWAR